MPGLVTDKPPSCSQASLSQMSPSSAPFSTENTPFSSQERSPNYMEHSRRSEYKARKSFNIGIEGAPNQTPTFGTVENFENLNIDETKTFSSLLRRNAS